MKLDSQPTMVAEFGKIGLGQWFRYLTAGIETIGGIALLVPRMSIMGALLLLLVDIGAFIAQVSILHLDWVHTIVLAAMLTAVIVLSRKNRR